MMTAGPKKEMVSLILLNITDGSAYKIVCVPTKSNGCISEMQKLPE